MKKKNLLFIFLTGGLLFINFSCERKLEIRKEYTHILEVEYSNFKDPKPFIDKMEYTLENYSDEDSYLSLYSRICYYSILNVMPGDSSKISLLKIQLINDQGEDILPTINFPDKDAKEMKVWKRNQITEVAKKKWVIEMDSIQLSRPDILEVLSETVETENKQEALDKAKKIYEERIRKMEKRRAAIPIIEKLERPILINNTPLP